MLSTEPFFRSLLVAEKPLNRLANGVQYPLAMPS
jgi:hypothetical protein